MNSSLIKKILKKYLVILIVGNFCNINLFGQKDFVQGYIIKNIGDTVYGLINLGGPVVNAKYCQFKEDKTSKITKYSPSELVGYRFINGKYYISNDISYQLNSDRMKEFEKIETNRKNGNYIVKNTEQKDSLLDGFVKNELIQKKVFLEYLINGRVDIYVYFDSYGDPHYFTKLEKDSLIKLENTKGVVYNQYHDDYFIEKKEYVGQLNYMLSDCDGIYSKIINTNLQNKSLIKLAKYYHYKTCTNSDEECIIYEKKNIKTHIFIIPVLSYSNLKVTSSELTKAYKYEFKDNNIISLGAMFNFSNFQYLNDNLSIQFGLIFQKQHFESKDTITIMDFSVLNTPFGIKYSFLLNSNIRPFVGLMACPNLRLKKNLESYYPLKLSGLKKAPLSYSGQIGFDYVINKKLFITNSVQYKIGKSFYTMNFDESKYHEFIIHLGLGYKINQD